MSATMGKDHLAREQVRLDRSRGRRIAGPGLAALVLGVVVAGYGVFQSLTFVLAMVLLGGAV